MKPSIEELVQRIEKLEAQLNAFSNASEMSPNVIKTITQILTTSTTKTAASATQAVDEAQANVYSVMKPPSGFISIGGKNIPYIN